MTTMFRLLWEDDGQDLIEYALLTAAIGVAGMVAFQVMSANINTTYRAWDVAVNNRWEVPDPQ